MRVLINAASAKMGGAATYIKNVARDLAVLNLPDEFIFCVPKEQALAISGLAPNVRVTTTEFDNEPFWKRLWFDQVTLRRIVKRERVDVLYSTANFGMFGCPCRQVLLVRIPLHFSKHYLTHILPNKGWHARLGNAIRRWLICQSVKWTDVVMTPSQAMLDDLRQFVKVPAEKALVNYYGTNVEPFQFNEASRQPPNENKSREYRLLYTSLYAEHKNISTLLRALIQLIESGLSCRLITPADPNWEAARITSTYQHDAQLAAHPRIINHIEFTGVLASEQIVELYRTADVFVYPSEIESFGHPLIEAMAAGVPIVAADAAINRELCQTAAVYFSPLDVDDCARQVRRVLEDGALSAALIEQGLQRRKLFRWHGHVERLLQTFGEPRTEHAVLLQNTNE